VKTSSSAAICSLSSADRDRVLAGESGSDRPGSGQHRAPCLRVRHSSLRRGGAGQDRNPHRVSGAAPEISRSTARRRLGRRQFPAVLTGPRGRQPPGALAKTRVSKRDAARFTSVDSEQRLTYLMTLVFLTVASSLRITPAAQHRVLFRQRDTECLIRSNWYAKAGTGCAAAAVGSGSGSLWWTRSTPARLPRPSPPAPWPWVRGGGSYRPDTAGTVNQAPSTLPRATVRDELGSPRMVRCRAVG